LRNGITKFVLLLLYVNAIYVIIQIN